MHPVEKAARYNRLLEIERNYRANIGDTVRKRTSELADALLMVKGMSREVVMRLTSVAEFRDAHTGAHI